MTDRSVVDSPLPTSMVSIPTGVTVAVLVPCFNEAVTIGSVVRDFRACLPDSTVYVYDNNSSDSTKQIARQAGAVVRSEGV